MKHPSDFAICISSYLTKHLAGTRNLSSNTIKSYRDTFCLLLLFMKEMNKKIDRICLVDIDADLVIRFLDWLEVNRGNSASTRNVRLAAIHAFFRYVQFQNPEMLLLPAYSCNSDERNRKEVCGIPAGTGVERATFTSRPDEKIWDTRYGAAVFAL